MGRGAQGARAAAGRPPDAARRHADGAHRGRAARPHRPRARMAGACRQCSARSGLDGRRRRVRPLGAGVAGDGRARCLPLARAGGGDRRAAGACSAAKVEALVGPRRRSEPALEHAAWPAGSGVSPRPRRCEAVEQPIGRCPPVEAVALQQLNRSAGDRASADRGSAAEDRRSHCRAAARVAASERDAHRQRESRHRVSVPGEAATRRNGAPKPACRGQAPTKRSPGDRTARQSARASPASPRSSCRPGRPTTRVPRRPRTTALDIGPVASVGSEGMSEAEAGLRRAHRRAAKRSRRRWSSSMR